MVSQLNKRSSGRCGVGKPTDFALLLWWTVTIRKGAWLVGWSVGFRRTRSLTHSLTCALNHAHTHTHTHNHAHTDSRAPTCASHRVRPGSLLPLELVNVRPHNMDLTNVDDVPSNPLVEPIVAQSAAVPAPEFQSPPLQPRRRGRRRQRRRRLLWDSVFGLRRHGEDEQGGTDDSVDDEHHGIAPSGSSGGSGAAAYEYDDGDFVPDRRRELSYNASILAEVRRGLVVATSRRACL